MDYRRSWSDTCFVPACRRSPADLLRSLLSTPGAILSTACASGDPGYRCRAVVWSPGFRACLFLVVVCLLQPAPGRTPLVAFAFVDVRSIRWRVDVCQLSVVRLRVAGPRRDVDERRRNVANTEMRTDKSKAFRCVLPRVREDHICHIQTRSANECAMSVLFANGSGKVVLVALRDKERNAASFSRTLRSVLRRFSIDDRSLKGTWLNLLTVQEALQLCSDSEMAVPTKTKEAAHEADEVKTVCLA